MKCEFCKDEAAYRFSPDLDINGLGACKKHKEDLQLAYMVLMTEGEEAYNSFMRSRTRKAKLNKPESKTEPPKK